MFSATGKIIQSRTSKPGTRGTRSHIVEAEGKTFELDTGLKNCLLAVGSAITIYTLRTISEYAPDLLNFASKVYAPGCVNCDAVNCQIAQRKAR